MVGFYCWFLGDRLEEAVGAEIVRFEGGPNIGSSWQLMVDVSKVLVFRSVRVTLSSCCLKSAF